MEKYISIVLALLSLAVCATGCSAISGYEQMNSRPQSSDGYTSSNINNDGCLDNSTLKHYDQYTSLIIDSALNEYAPEAELKPWSGTYFKKENISERSCSVLGRKYWGTYEDSIIESMTSYVTNNFVDESGIRFAFKDGTNELVYFNLMNHDYFDSVPFLPDVNNPYESAVCFATEIAGTFVGNIADYTQIIEEPRKSYYEKNGESYEITYYIITFAKKINDYFSSDFISIRVTSKGTLASIVMGDINAFDGVILDFDPTAVNNSIAEKVDASFENGDLNVTQWNVVEQTIVKTPNNDICMYSTVEIKGTTLSGYEIKTGIRILTVLDKRER